MYVVCVCIYIYVRARMRTWRPKDDSWGSVLLPPWIRFKSSAVCSTHSTRQALSLVQHPFSWIAGGIFLSGESGCRRSLIALPTSQEMPFGFATQLEFLCCEQLYQAIKKYQKDGHGHDNHIVADAGSNIKPAPRILDQEEKMQSHDVWYDKNNEEKPFWWQLCSYLNCFKSTHHKNKRN